MCRGGGGPPPPGRGGGPGGPPPPKGGGPGGAAAGGGGPAPRPGRHPPRGPYWGPGGGPPAATERAWARSAPPPERGWMVGEADREGVEDARPGCLARFRLDHVPDAADAVAGHVARLGVLDEEVERPAVTGPHLLHGAVLVLDVDDRPCAVGRRAFGGEERRPVGDTLVDAGRHRCALGVLVEDVEGHAVPVGEDCAERCVHGSRRPRGMGCRACEKGGRERDYDSFHVRCSLERDPFGTGKDVAPGE